MIEFLQRNYELMKEMGHSDEQLTSEYEFACASNVYFKLPIDIRVHKQYLGIQVVMDEVLPPHYLMLRKIEIKPTDIVHGIYIDTDDDSVA